jgi:hypothetical protein
MIVYSDLYFSDLSNDTVRFDFRVAGYTLSTKFDSLGPNETVEMPLKVTFHPYYNQFTKVGRYQLICLDYFHLNDFADMNDESAVINSECFVLHCSNENELSVYPMKNQIELHKKRTLYWPVR